MKNQILSAAPLALHGELRGLFAHFPFQEMDVGFAHNNNCGGITFPDSSIFILRDEDAGWMLACYLHEVAHASLIRAGHPRAFDHGDDFVRICRTLEVRYGVLRHAWHAYDQQDAAIKTTFQQSSKAAMAEAMAIDYDPTGRALHAAIAAVQADHRHNWRYALIMGGAAIAVIAGITAPWAQWFAAIGSALDADIVKLAVGGAIAGWIYFSTRR